MADQIGNILWKFFSSLILSIAMLLVGFSFMTGQFPPRKDEIYKVLTIVQGIYSTTNEVNQAGAAIKASQAGGAEVSLEEMVAYQRLALRRSELTLELTKIYKKLNFGGMDEQMQQDLQLISHHMQQAELNLEKLTQKIESQQTARGN